MIKMHLFRIALFLFTPMAAFAQERQFTANSSIKNVILYLYGAQVNREATVDLDNGTTQLVIPGLSSKLNEGSIQVSADNRQVKILSVSLRSGDLWAGGRGNVLHMLLDSIEEAKMNIEMEKNNHYILTQEESLLLSNKNVAGEKGVMVPELEDALTLYRTQLPEIRKKMLYSAKRQRELQAKLDTLNRRYNEFKSGTDQGRNEIVLLVSTSGRTRSNIKVSYFVADASWRPVYDIRSEGPEAQVLLEYKAEIRQNTGEVWNNVDMTLSTSNPNLSGNIPVLYSQYLNIYDPVIYNKVMMASPGYDVEAVPLQEIDIDRKEKGRVDEEATRNVSIGSAPVPSFSDQIQMTIELPYKVKLTSDNKTQVIELNSHELPALYEYKSIPKLEGDVFLSARITGWENLNLISGSANVIFNGTYLGKTYINANNPQDTLTVSLGRDKRILVERKLVKELSSKNVTGSRIKEDRVFEIDIRNNKRDTVTLSIEDQLPIAQNRDIEVEIKEIDGAMYDENTGKLTWTRTINPAESIKIRFAYRVVYPKNKQISGL